MRRIGKRVGKRFAHRTEVRIQTDFPFMRPSVAGNGALHVGFAETAILKRDNRRRGRIRRQSRADGPDHRACVRHDGGSEDALIGDLGRRVVAAPLLPLARLFLNAFIGYEEVRLAVTEYHAEAIGIRELALELDRDTRSGAAVCKVLFDRWIEIAARVVRAPADPDEGA